MTKRLKFEALRVVLAQGSLARGTIGVYAPVTQATPEATRMTDYDISIVDELLARVRADNDRFALLVFDMDLRYVVAEGRPLSNVGLSAETILGRTMHEVLGEEAVGRLEPLYRRALSGDLISPPLGARSPPGGHSRTLSLTLDVAVPKSGKPLALHGDADVYKMRRLRWLDYWLCRTEWAILYCLLRFQRRCAHSFFNSATTSFLMASLSYFSVREFLDF